MIYTEQSYNVGETPIRGCFVGLLVGDSKDEIYGRIVASTRNYIILLTDDDFEFSYNKLEIQFRPYNTRTDTEKAIDDLADGISASYSDDQSFKEDAINMLNFIKAGKIHGVTFTGDK